MPLLTDVISSFFLSVFLSFSLRYAESYTRKHAYTLAASVAEVRAAPLGDRYFLDTATSTLYWRVISGYVKNTNEVGADGATFGWVDYEKQLNSFSRAGLTVVDTCVGTMCQMHIVLDCPTDASGHFCAKKAAGFKVPAMGCPVGEVMVAIDMCGKQCELDGTCGGGGSGGDVPCVGGTSFSASGNAPCTTCTALSTCGGSGSKSACVATKDLVCNVPCTGGTGPGSTWSSSGVAPCSDCAAAATCTHGVSTTCTTQKNTVCKAAPACEDGSTWSSSGSAPCQPCATASTCPTGVKTACVPGADIVCTGAVATCIGGTSFSGTGSEPCTPCTTNAACASGVKYVCNTATDTVCKDSSSGGTGGGGGGTPGSNNQDGGGAGTSGGGASPSSPGSPGSPSAGPPTSVLGVAIGIAVGAVVLMVILVVASVLLILKRRKGAAKGEDGGGSGNGGGGKDVEMGAFRRHSNPLTMDMSTGSVAGN